MKIANNNNNNVSFKSFSSHLQENMRTPICAAFAQRIGQLEKEFANDPVVHVSIYDIFSSAGKLNGKHKRVIGASVTVQEGYAVPNFRHCDSLVKAAANSDGEEFAKFIRAKSAEVQFNFVSNPSRPPYLELWGDF